jgi:hypothetical protein
VSVVDLLSANKGSDCELNLVPCTMY